MGMGFHLNVDDSVEFITEKVKDVFFNKDLGILESA